MGNRLGNGLYTSYYIAETNDLLELCMCKYNILENVQHCGGEPEQADRILTSGCVMKHSMFSASWHNGSLTNSTAMDLLNAADSSPCTSIVYQACLISVPSDHLLSFSLWCWLCNLAPDAICLSHSVDLSALSYTVRNPPSYSVDPLHRTLESFSTCATLKCTCTFVSVRSI